MSWSQVQHGPIAVLTYSRPPQNRMPFSTLAELDRHLVAIGNNQSVSLVVLASGCPGVFSLGAELNDIQKMRAGEEPSAPYDEWLRTLSHLESMPQPVIAAVDGRAANGGCELALACTMRIGSPAAEFTQNEISRGAIPGAGGSQRLPRLIGYSRASSMLFTARLVGSREAREVGLLEEILEGDPFLEAVLAWAAPIAAHSRIALIAMKRALMEGRNLHFKDSLILEQRLFRAVIRPE